jgi:hypothetical protein
MNKNGHEPREPVDNEYTTYEQYLEQYYGSTQTENQLVEPYALGVDLAKKVLRDLRNFILQAKQTPRATWHDSRNE